MNSKRNIVIGSCLKSFRVEAGLTQRQVAQRLGKTQSFVSKVENADRELSLIEVFPYADALETDYTTLVDFIHTNLIAEDSAD